jgi:hypothetical protein
MVANPLRRTGPRVISVLGIAALLAVCGRATAIAALKSTPTHHTHSTSLATTSLAGAWSGHYSGAISGTFTLHWTQSGSSLTGSITLSSPSGKYGVSGSVHGTAISFGAVGAGATYTGSVSGQTKMSGSWKAPIGGGTWSAEKSS